MTAAYNANTKTVVLTLGRQIATKKLKNFKLQVLGTGTIHNEFIPQAVKNETFYSRAYA